jgi:hypothetical protein
LEGIAPQGACPECAMPYTRELALRLDPHPGQWVLAWRLGWPLAALALCSYVASFGLGIFPVGGGVAFVMAMQVVITWFVDIPQTITRHIPPEERSRFRLVSLLRLGPVPLAVGVINGLCTAAIVLVGGFILLFPFVLAALALWNATL